MSKTHDGHRERVKKQFLKEGFSEYTPPHKLLEMLLFFSIPRKDTNEIAHNLIKTFGSFDAVLDAPLEELVKIKGITENSVCLLKSIMPAARLYYESKQIESLSLSTLSTAADYLASKFTGRNVETVFMLSLNNRGRILGCTKLSEGDSISVGLTTRTVVEEALKVGATAILLGHNHPQGFALPSEADIRKTIEIAKTLHTIGVVLLDHIIVADNDYVSLSQSSQYKSIFERYSEN